MPLHARSRLTCYGIPNAHHRSKTAQEERKRRLPEVSGFEDSLGRGLSVIAIAMSVAFMAGSKCGMLSAAPDRHLTRRPLAAF